jgi:cytochrome P450
LDTLRFAVDVILPTLAKGVIVRRPRVLALAEQFDFDARAVRRLQHLRHRYGTGPLRFRILGREIGVILAPRDVHRVLSETPEPFAAATREKVAALSHFEPKNVLLSQGAERVERRRYNEEVLDTARPVHHLAEHFIEVIAEENRYLRNALSVQPILTWEIFARTWFRIVRRVIFGDAAREDTELSREMHRLRSAANWAFLSPKRGDLLQSLLNRIKTYLREPDPDSLAGVMARAHVSAETAPEQQVPQWLFAFDPAGMATFRSLALLTSHLEEARIIRAEVETHDDPARMPLLRATVLESLRLWPTSPLILRENLVETAWENGTLPARTAIVIFTPFFHRDDEQLPYAHRFSPELWTEDQPTIDWPLIPFSEGPAVCPGRELVLLLTTAMLADLLKHARFRLRPGSNIRLGRPLPGTLNHFALQFDVRA